MKKVIVFAHMHTFLPFLLELESNTNYNGGSCFVKDRRYIILGEYDKAYKYIDKALTSPRCFFCSEVKCIDAMCSLAYLEYVKGNIDKVKAHLDEIFKLDISRTDAIGLAYKIGLFK